VAVDRSQPDCVSSKNNGGGYLRERPTLVGRAMALTDIAAALFFRAVTVTDSHHARVTD
jgi:hypothetical protein